MALFFYGRTISAKEFLFRMCMESEIESFKATCGPNWQSVWVRVYEQVRNNCQEGRNPYPYINSLRKVYQDAKVPVFSCSTSSNYEEMDSADKAYASKLQSTGFSETYFSKASILDRLVDLYVQDPALYDYLAALTSGEVTSKSKQQARKKIKTETFNALDGIVKNVQDSKIFFDACRGLVNAVNKKNMSKGKDKVLIKEVSAIYPPVEELSFVDIMSQFLPSNPVLKCDGHMVDINPATCLSECDTGISIDFYDSNKWELLSDSQHKVLRIDISPLMNWLEYQLIGDLGTSDDNVVCTHLNGKYSLMLPSGKRLVGLDKTTFLDTVHKEVIYSLLSNNVTTMSDTSTVIGITRDYLYVQPQRKSYNKLIYKTQYFDKVFEFPILIRSFSAN